MAKDPLSAYKQNSVINAKQEELTLMLYDGALKFMYIADERLKDEKTKEGTDSGKTPHLSCPSGYRNQLDCRPSLNLLFKSLVHTESD